RCFRTISATRHVTVFVVPILFNLFEKHFLFSHNCLGLVRMTARLRMKRLGLGELTKIPAVSEAAALEQASDFVQQLVLFTYSLGVFWGYYIYTKVSTPETLKVYEFEEFREESEKVIGDLQLRVEQLEAALKNRGIKSLFRFPVISPPAVDNKDTHSTSQTNKEETTQENQPSQLPETPFPTSVVITRGHRLQCIAQRLLGGEEFLVVRSGTSVGIEPVALHRSRGVELVFREKPSFSKSHPSGIVGLAENCVTFLLGGRSE
ncbi:hypothetical protein OSTOST_15791, partial [Ostertagia ostertagi]